MIYDKFTLLICGDTFRMHLIPFLNVFKSKTIRHCKRSEVLNCFQNQNLLIKERINPTINLIVTFPKKKKNTKKVFDVHGITLINFSCKFSLSLDKHNACVCLRNTRIRNCICICYIPLFALIFSLLFGYTCMYLDRAR